MSFKLNKEKIKLAVAEATALSIIKSLNIEDEKPIIEDLTANIYYINDLLSNNIITKETYNQKMMDYIGALMEFKEDQNIQKIIKEKQNEKDDYNGMFR